MLVIRREQMEEFSQVARARFEDEMVAHSRDFSPRLCEIIGEDQLRVALCSSIKRADAHGFTNRGPIRLFIELMFLFGSSFDTDPQYPWAAEILCSSDEQMQRAERLYEKVIDYQERVSGPDAANTRKALEGLLTLAGQKTLPFSENDFITGILQEMNRIFPQKTAYIGEGRLRGLIQEGSVEAKNYCFTTVRGEGLVVVLMFAFGHGCLDDPLYPWIMRTLNDPKIATSSARTERLEKKARTWLTHVLARSPEGAPQ